MATVSAFGGTVNRLVPASPSHLHCTGCSTPSRQPDHACRQPGATNAEIAGSDELASAPCHQRHHGTDYELGGYRRCHPWPESGSRRSWRGNCATAGVVKASEETILKSLVGDGVPLRAFVQLAAGSGHLSPLPEADCGMRPRDQVSHGRFGFAVPTSAPSVVVPVQAAAAAASRGASTADAQLQQELHRPFSAFDLTLIPRNRRRHRTNHPMSKIGPDLSAFRSGPAFVSWLPPVSRPPNQRRWQKSYPPKTRPTKRSA